MGVIYFFQNFYPHIPQKGDRYLPFVKLDGGADGSRTHVRKHLHPGVSERSQHFKIPSAERLLTASGLR